MRRCTAIVWLLLSWLGAQSQTGAQSGPPNQQAGHRQDESSANTQPRIDPAKEADIRKLMELSGAQTLASQTMDRMTQSLRPLMTGALPPGEYREKLIDLFFAKFRSKADPKPLLDMAPNLRQVFLTRRN